MTVPILYSRDADNIVTLTFDSDGQRVNTLNDEMRDCLIATIERVVREKDSIAGVIFASAKSTFFAGGDLNYLYQLKAEDADQLFDQITAVKRAFRQLETLGKPVVAAINGSAVGGGFELALACHYRVCINDPKTQLGLPEASLGLLPGLGGVVRMNLLLGLVESQSYLQEGKLFNPERAFKAGMVDQLVADAAELMRAARAWILSGPDAVQPWDRDDYQVPGARPGDASLDAWIATAMEQLRSKTKGCYPAPEVILSCSIAGMKVDFDRADLIETHGFIELVTGSVAKNLIGTFWFQLNSLKAGAGRPKGIELRHFSRVILFGSGAIRDELRDLLVSRRMDVSLQDFPTDGTIDQDFSNAQLLIEFAPENPVLKARVISDAGQPTDSIGFHFSLPLRNSALVEVITLRETSLRTLAHAMDFVLQLGKTPVVVNNSLESFTHRIKGIYVAEVQSMLEQGQSNAWIETGLLAAGFTNGSAALLDVTSLRQSATPSITLLSEQDIKDRLLFSVALESVRLLQAGVLSHVRDGNIGSVMGMGYPRWTGGVFQFLNQYGLSNAVDRAQELATQYGERFAAPELLIQKAGHAEQF